MNHSKRRRRRRRNIRSQINKRVDFIYVLQNLENFEVVGRDVW